MVSIYCLTLSLHVVSGGSFLLEAACKCNQFCLVEHEEFWYVVSV